MFSTSSSQKSLASSIGHLQFRPAKFDLLIAARKFDSDPSSRHVSFDLEVDAEMADEWVSNFNYVNQRLLNKLHALTLAEAMSRNEFREFTNIEFGVIDGVPYLINGQHTLNAIKFHGSKLWLAVHFTRAKDKEKLAGLYGTIDTGRKRSVRDSIIGVADELNLAAKEADSLAVAVSLINLGFRRNSGTDTVKRLYEGKSSALKKSLMYEWSTEAHNYFNAIRKAEPVNRSFFLRGPVVAIGIYTFRHQPEVAATFWGEASRDDGLRTGDPRKSLFNWLRTNSSGKSPSEQHRAAIACWNAWYRKRELHKVYPQTNDAMSICGTPLEFQSQI